MPMPKGFRPMPGERGSEKYPGLIERLDGTFRKRVLLKNGKRTNIYFVMTACGNCGLVHPSDKKNVGRAQKNYCSNECLRASRRAPDGSRTRKRCSHGPVMVKLRDHPAANGSNCVPEHRLIVERSIGRFLSKKEVVHHINMVETDNRVENLHLFSSNSEHFLSHGSLNGCVAQLIEMGMLKFDKGTARYSVVERTEQVARRAA
jgi:hypothetical protein